MLVDIEASDWRFEGSFVGGDVGVLGDLDSDGFLLEVTQVPDLQNVLNIDRKKFALVRHKHQMIYLDAMGPIQLLLITLERDYFDGAVVGAKGQHGLLWVLSHVGRDAAALLQRVNGHFLRLFVRAEI
jgi:hypothetical protein